MSAPSPARLVVFFLLISSVLRLPFLNFSRNMKPSSKNKFRIFMLLGAFLDFFF